MKMSGPAGATVGDEYTLLMFQTPADALAFLLSGNAIATFVSKRTGTRFTYRIQAPREPRRYQWINNFVSVLTGPDNSRDYEFLGTLQGDERAFVHAASSRIAADAPAVRAFAWAWLWLRRDVMPEELEIHHEGRCGRCGRRLTTPESITRGIGPECAQKGGMGLFASRGA